MLPVRPPIAALRAAGLRVTEPRLVVLAVLAAAPHADVEQLHRLAVARLGTLSKQAVYDILGAFCAVGLAQRVQPAGGPARFEARVGDNHHHIVCRGCGAVADVDCVTGRAPCLEPSARHGFDVEEADITFWGRCAACRATPEPVPHPSAS